jgi:hypothetical protein
MLSEEDLKKEECVIILDGEQNNKTYRSSETETDLSLIDGFTSFNAAMKSSIEIGGKTSFSTSSVPYAYTSHTHGERGGED